MSGKSDEPYFALFFGFAQGFGRAVGANEQLGIVVESNAVNLPEIKMIGLQAVERLLQHLHREIGVPTVRAYLRHQENLIATAF